jgi:glycosyltransferase involved in cell wall biosynthesis
MLTPTLSVVVIGRNEGVRLTRCLQSISEFDCASEIEVIYVDSASTDGSPENARRSNAQVVVLSGQGQTAARGRNAGWRRAHAEYVLFLDGDTILNPEFPQAAMKALQSDPRIAAVWGHRRELHPERTLYNRVLDLDWIYLPGITEYFGGDVMIRRTALVETGGYDPDLIAGEEPELGRRLRARGYLILHIDTPMTLHDFNMTRFRQYWRRALRAGYAYAEMSDRFGRSSDPMWRGESRRNIIRGTAWMAWGCIGVAIAALFRGWGVLVWIAVLAAFSVRSAWKARYRAPGQKLLLLLYGIHSHLQHVPVLFGQIQYWRGRRLGKQGRIIEYKEETDASNSVSATP